MFVADEDMFFVPRRETHKTEPSGVRFDPLRIKSNKKHIKININYIDTDIKKNKGVQNDNKPQYIISKKSADCLNFRRPCLCGSFQHRRTNDRECLLNPNYFD